MQRLLIFIPNCYTVHSTGADRPGGKKASDSLALSITFLYLTKFTSLLYCTVQDFASEIAFLEEPCRADRRCNQSSGQVPGDPSPESSPYWHSGKSLISVSASLTLRYLYRTVIATVQRSRATPSRYSDWPLIADGCVFAR